MRTEKSREKKSKTEKKKKHWNQKHAHGKKEQPNQKHGHGTGEKNYQASNTDTDMERMRTTKNKARTTTQTWHGVKKKILGGKKIKAYILAL